VTETPDLLVLRDARVLWLTINRPRKHNALSRALLAALAKALRAHAKDMTLACAVITGTGNRYFSAGGDLLDLEKVRTPSQTRVMARTARAVLDAVREFPLPVIALVNGDALGGGAELALACDMRVMSSAARIGFIQGTMNITPAWGGGSDLVQLVGPARALRILARSERVGARGALQCGLADAVFLPARMRKALGEFVAPIVAQTGAVLRGCKAQALAARSSESFTTRRRIELGSLVATWTSAEHWAAVDRFFKR